MTLNSLVIDAMRMIERYLKDKINSKEASLEKSTLWALSMKEKKDGTITHEIKPIHMLAFILAYKKLETEGKITIQRPKDVPYPMTDYETLFSI